jgi:hypothetical protein
MSGQTYVTATECSELKWYGREVRLPKHHKDVDKQIGSSGNTSDLYLGSAEFESQPEHQLM